MATPRSRRAAAILWLAVAVAVAATVAGRAAAGRRAGRSWGCFCDCMMNRCMTLGAADKFDCAGACTEACTQIGKPGQPKEDDFCGF